MLLMISSAQKNGVLPQEYADRFLELQDNTKVLFTIFLALLLAGSVYFMIA